MFFLCTFLRGVLLSAMPKRILWAEKCSLECFFFLPLYHWAHWRALCRWTHAVQPPREEKTPGNIWGGTLNRQEASLNPQTAKAAEVSSWHRTVSAHRPLFLPSNVTLYQSYSIPYFLTVPQLLSLNKSGISVRFLYFSWMAGALRNGPIFGMMCYLSVPLKKSCVSVLQLCCDFQMHYAVRDDPLAHQQLQSWVTLITLLTLLPNHLIGNQPQLWRPQHTGRSQWKAI